MSALWQHVELNARPLPMGAAMFELVSVPVRRAIAVAQREAQRSGQERVTSGHLLVGILDPDGADAMNLLDLGLGSAVVDQLAALEKSGQDVPRGESENPLKTALEVARDIAVAEKGETISTRRFFRAIMKTEETIAGEILKRLNVDVRALLERIDSRLSDDKEAPRERLSGENTGRADKVSRTLNYRPRKQ